MKIKNINGTSDNTCTCGSWLKHWEKLVSSPPQLYAQLLLALTMIQSVHTFKRLVGLTISGIFIHCVSYITNLQAIQKFLIDSHWSRQIKGKLVDDIMSLQYLVLYFEGKIKQFSILFFCKSTIFFIGLCLIKSNIQFFLMCL